MAGSDNSVGKFWFFLILTIVVIQLVGSGYRGLRFVNDFEITTAPIVECSKEHEARAQANTEWYEFEITLQGVDYPIFVIGDATPREWGWSMFKTPPPRFDWCELKGESVTVYHSKAVRGGIVFRKAPKERLGVFQLLWKMESGAGTVGIVLFGILCIIALIVGMILLIAAARRTLSRVVVPHRNEHGPVAYIKFVNDLVVPFISWLLASMLAFTFGLILIKGMLFVETRFDFLSGLIVITGALLATTAPAGLLTFVYTVKTSKSEWIKLLANILTIAAFTPLLVSWYTLFARGDFTRFYDDGFWSFMWSVVTSVFT